MYSSQYLASMNKEMHSIGKIEDALISIALSVIRADVKRSR